MSPILESLNAFSAAGLTAILNTLWLALAVAAVMWFALRLMPRVNAATRHAVWWVVLALVVLMPLTTLLPRSTPSGPSSALTEKQIRTRAVASTGMKPLPRGVPDTVPFTGANASVQPMPQALPQAPLSGLIAMPRVHIPVEFHSGNWASSLLFLWMAACCILLVRIVCGYLRLRGLRNHARRPSADLVVRFEQCLRNARISRTPELLVSDEVISPLATGFLHPVVILPEILLEEIADADLEYVLLHELAHVARRDDWTNLVCRLASAILVFHPVAAWVLRRIRREREIACDDWVVAATGSAVSYAVTLGRVAEFCSARRRELLATEMAHQSSNIGERIETLLRPRSYFSPGASLSRVSLCVAASLALLSFGVRIPGWIALAQDTTVASAHNQSVPQSQASVARAALSHESSPGATPELLAELSPTSSAQFSTTPETTLTDQDKTWRHEWKLTRDSSSSKVRFSLISRNDDGNDQMNTEGLPLSSLSGFSLSMLDRDGPVKFEYLRDSGRIICEGTVARGHASGPFTVALNPEFVSALQKMGYSAPHDDEAFSLVISDVTLSYAQSVRDTGLTSSISDLVELQNHGVSAEYVRAVRKEGFIDLSASNITNLRDHGVKPDYLKAMKSAGPNLSIEEIDSLFDHGVKPDYYASIKASVPQLTIEQINSLCDHGVRPDYYSSIKATAPQLSIEEIDSLYDHGVKPDSYKGFASADSRLTIEEINSLYDHGVKPDYYRSMRSANPNLSIEQIDTLFDHGVRPDSYKGFTSVDSKLSTEEISSLRDHGVEPEFYQGTRAADSMASIEEINTLRDHGVQPEYLKEIRTLPDRFSISDISELRDHGITAKYIRNLHDMGMKNMTAAQIVHLREGN